MIYAIEYNLVSAMQLTNHFRNHKAVRPHTSWLLIFCRNRGIKIACEAKEMQWRKQEKQAQFNVFSGRLSFGSAFLSGGPIYNFL